MVTKIERNELFLSNKNINSLRLYYDELERNANMLRCYSTRLADLWQWDRRGSARRNGMTNLMLEL